MPGSPAELAEKLTPPNWKNSGQSLNPTFEPRLFFFKHWRKGREVHTRIGVAPLPAVMGTCPTLRVSGGALLNHVGSGLGVMVSRDWLADWILSLIHI